MTNAIKTYAPALLCLAVMGLAACGGGGGGSTSGSVLPPTGGSTIPAPASATTPTTPSDTTFVSGKTPVNFRVDILSSLVGTYSSAECTDSADPSKFKPGVIAVAANGALTVNGSIAGNLYDADWATTVQRQPTPEGGTTQGFTWIRDVKKTPAGALFFQVFGPTIHKGESGINIQAMLNNSQLIGCFIPGNLNLVSKPAFFAAQKYLEVQVKDWSCIDGVNKPMVNALGGYKNIGGEALIGAETFSASSNFRLEILNINFALPLDPDFPTRGQSLAYTVETNGGRLLHAFHNDVGELVQAGATKSTLPAYQAQPDNIYICKAAVP